MTDYALGPLPWSEEVLTKAYFRDFRLTQESIKEHPGMPLMNGHFLSKPFCGYSIKPLLLFLRPSIDFTLKYTNGGYSIGYDVMTSRIWKRHSKRYYICSRPLL